MRVHRSVGPPQPVQHHIASIVQLQRKPVPAGLSLFEEAGTEFVIHPARAVHLHLTATDSDRSGGRHARQRVIEGGIAGILAFLAESVGSVERGWLALLQRQRETHVARPVSRFEVVSAILDPRRPTAIPDRAGVRPSARPADALPAERLGGVERPSSHVGDGEVRHVEIADRPHRRVYGLPIDSNPEERELVPEAAAVDRVKIAGVVPPFQTVVGMADMIGRQDQKTPRRRMEPSGIRCRAKQRRDCQSEDGDGTRAARHSSSRSTGSTAAATRAG